ncbi:hypothetical protein [Hydrogenophaga intermedia]|uniref:Stationary phase growth adaptation protein n=1 Tax=Hydrogenophaga intermedia TaxID=65786 RepID=A0A1L1PUF1_HYDIT|nr:hypothetical protein [Hydrogenophaga intermedia]TMU70127.1 hypothetical protein FGJ01_24355 [Hydrogenophaga intermedia]CDN90527.1 hypothetical protein BN948_04972 [Hydrogenophaga intermedia]
MTQAPPLIDAHSDVAGGYRFSGVVYRGEAWNLSHLDPFAFRAALSETLMVDVVVLFSCHCFTHGLDHEDRDDIPKDEWFMEGNVRRVLDPERYELSRRHLPTLIQQLHERHIKVLGGSTQNFLTFETVDREGKAACYSVFFEVRKDAARKKRIILRVQSAYLLDELTQRQRNARKVNLNVLLKAVYDGRTIRA